MNILQAIRDPNVFAPFFRGSTWDAWFVFLAALFAPAADARAAGDLQQVHRTQHATKQSLA